MTQWQPSRNTTHMEKPNHCRMHLGAETDVYGVGDSSHNGGRHDHQGDPAHPAHEKCGRKKGACLDLAVERLEGMVMHMHRSANVCYYQFYEPRLAPILHMEQASERLRGTSAAVEMQYRRHGNLPVGQPPRERHSAHPEQLVNCDDDERHVPAHSGIHLRTSATTRECYMCRH